MITLKIALRNIFRHKMRSIITLSSIAFGCIALVFVGGYFEDIFRKMRETYIHGHTGHIQIFRKGFFKKGSAQPFDYLIDNPKDIIGRIKNIQGVNFITSRLEFSGFISTGETTVSFIGQGIEPENEKAISASEIANAKQYTAQGLMISGMVVESGKSLSGDDTYAIIVGKGLAAGVGVSPGSGLILVTNTVAGSINALDVTLKGIFTTSSKQFDDHFIRLPIDTAQKLLHTESVQSLMVMLDKTEDVQKVKKEIEHIFGVNNIDLELKTWDELSDFYTKSVALFNRMFLILKLIVAIIVILSIFNTMNMAVLERTNEIGTIMALGTRRRGVLKLFLYEGLGLGLIGGIIGIILGAIITAAIAKIGISMPPAPGLTFSWVSEPMLVPSTLIFAFVLSLITSLVSSLYPAYKASRLEIAEALRRT